MLLLSRATRVTLFAIGILEIVTATEVGCTTSSAEWNTGGAVILGTFVATAAVLMLVSMTGRVRSKRERNVVTVLEWSAAASVIGYGCISIEIALHPGANIPGLITLAVAPFYWASIPVAAGAVLMWIGVRIWTQASPDESR
jgi:hypothetical protein